MTWNATILVVEDDPEQRRQLVGFLDGLGLDVREAADVPAARSELDAGGVDVVVSDLRMPGENGVDLLRWARPRHPLADFVVATAHGSVETAVEAMRLGAHDFLTKPIDLDVLEQRLERLLERRSLEREVRDLRERIQHRVDAAGVVAESPAMQRVLRLVRKVAAADATVLITGESGTGKEVVADLLHAWSRRRDGPFLRVNCGALPEALLESELFGHARGAFTGADREHTGLFREAEGGTLLLDEIGEIQLPLQVKLLRALQERQVRRVGDALPIAVDVRIVAATNRDLAREVEEGRFRRDLYFRLNVIELNLPPLRERPEDVAALVPSLLRRFADENGTPVPRLARAAHDALMAYRYPGNVRELQNVLQRATVLSSGGRIELDDLPEAVRNPDLVAVDLPAPTAERSLPQLVEDIERRAITRALREHSGVRVRAARALGLPERVLRYKLKTYGIDPTKLSDARHPRRSPGERRA